MHGKGTFYDPRLKDAARFPVAAAAGFDNVRNDEDRITSKLAALQFYQLALRAPRAPSKLFDRAAAERGQSLFTGKAKCSTCHVPPLYSEPGYNLHTPAEINIDAFQANRSPDGGYRTTPLKGLWTHTKGGFYHDGPVRHPPGRHRALRLVLRPRPERRGEGGPGGVPEVLVAAERATAASGAPRRVFGDRDGDDVRGRTCNRLPTV